MKQDHKLFALIEQEHQRQKQGLELIASENFVSQAVMEAVGSILTNKYAEGYPHRRYYGGCEFVDEVEELAIARAKTLFKASWANVQPHSGSQANAAVMLAVLNPGDKILGFDLSHGGHLTHGASVSFSGRLYEANFYGVSPEDGKIDWETVEHRAKAVRPKLLIAGGSAYSRDWDYQKMRAVADQVGAFLLADIAHPAGLIACGLLNDPLPYCHFVTTTTHKTLRGPRGGMVLMGHDFEYKAPNSGKTKPMSAILDASVFPGIQGGPLMHAIAGKAVALQEALDPSYLSYIQQVKNNASRLAEKLLEKDYTIVSGGTDNHLLLIDLCNKGITGKQAEQILSRSGITVNKNMVPFDEKSPFVTSGIRIGTSAATTRGLKEIDMDHIVHWIDRALKGGAEEKIQLDISKEIAHYMQKFPLFCT